MQVYASKHSGIALTVVSAIFFWLLSNIGYTVGYEFGLAQMYLFFGRPRDLYPILFSLVMVFTGYLLGLIGLVITLFLMHQIGRRFKVAVGKPTFYGFLLYLLTVLRVIILDNLNK